MSLVEATRRAFAARYGADPETVGVSPGRVNLIGDHTDYNGGLALPAAIDRHVVVAASPRPDVGLRLHSVDFDDGFALSELPALEAIRELPGPSWRRYVLGCLRVLADREPSPRPGLDLVVAGDLPVGAGLSSSAALELATLHAAALLWDLELPAMELCLLAQAVEHRVLGVRSGLLDQLACALSREGHLLLLDFRGPTFRLLPARLQGHAWLVVDSGVRRALGDTGYGRRVEECTEVLNTLREADPRIRTLGDASWELLPRVESRIGPTHAARLRHVLSENARVEAFARAFTLGDARAMGDLLLASHVSLRDDYASSCPALDRLVALAVADPACLGARVMGGGFGGCALLLVEEPALEAFEPRLLASYQQSVGIAPRAFRFELGGGARGFRARRA